MKIHRITRHSLPTCPATGLPRYRDRHQARHGALAARQAHPHTEIRPYPCQGCKGFHLDQMRAPLQVPPEQTSQSAPATRRYVLMDIENLTGGARITRSEMRALWGELKRRGPGITTNDHVVVGAARAVVHKYRRAVVAPNVKWIIGHDSADGADKALLAAIDLRRVARDYDELVIMSGDHVFASLAQRAKSAGLAIRVVTVGHEGLSRDLRMAADSRTQIRRNAFMTTVPRTAA